MSVEIDERHVFPRVFGEGKQFRKEEEVVALLLFREEANVKGTRPGEREKALDVDIFFVFFSRVVFVRRKFVYLNL